LATLDVTGGEAASGASASGFVAGTAGSAPANTAGGVVNRLGLYPNSVAGLFLGSEETAGYAGGGGASSSGAAAYAKSSPSAGRGASGHSDSGGETSPPISGTRHQNKYVLKLWLMYKKLLRFARIFLSKIRVTPAKSAFTLWPCSSKTEKTGNFIHMAFCDKNMNSRYLIIIDILKFRIIGVQNKSINNNE
jgi:hypothetical protein